MDPTPRFTGRSCPPTHHNYLAKSSIYPVRLSPHCAYICLSDFLEQFSRLIVCLASAWQPVTIHYHNCMLIPRFPPVDYSRYSSVPVFTFDPFVCTYITNEAWSTKWTTPLGLRMASTASCGSLEGLANTTLSTSRPNEPTTRPASLTLQTIEGTFSCFYFELSNDISKLGGVNVPITPH